MAIDRFELVKRHNPVLDSVDYSSPLSVGNGECAFTADITGLQTLYSEYASAGNPLCTLSQWGWHSSPAKDGKYYTLRDLEMTEYIWNRQKVHYAAEKRPGNEEVYNWLRQNPHRLNLFRLSFLWEGKEISSHMISEIRQELHLYEALLESRFVIRGVNVHVKTFCHPDTDCFCFVIDSPALADARLSACLCFPYGSSDITASDWNRSASHESRCESLDNGIALIHRKLDRNGYFLYMHGESGLEISKSDTHTFLLKNKGERLSVCITVSPVRKTPVTNITSTEQDRKLWWQNFWEEGAMIDFSGSRDPRAYELERRAVLSLYLLCIHSCGSLPPQETGLGCNSWYGKFHLEMHPLHTAFLPLWGRGRLLMRSLNWYREHLPQAQENAERNGYKGARWPKMTGPEAIDSPSPIATLLVWQQPHIIYMCELVHTCCTSEERGEDFTAHYWDIVRETAEFMYDLAVSNPDSGFRELLPPLIPVQEEFDPGNCLNPAFELEYWSLGLKLAAQWAQRMGTPRPDWEEASRCMAPLPVHDGVYIAHANRPDTFESFNRDHPSMLGVCGFLPGKLADTDTVRRTFLKVRETWDFDSMWGWDFAFMAMTMTRLCDPDAAVNILLQDTPKNTCVAGGNNPQLPGRELPLYLPGNGSLLLALAMMTAGFPGAPRKSPGFPDNGNWCINAEGLKPYPF